MDELCRKKKGCRKALRNKKNCRLYDAAKFASKAFENAANYVEKENFYEDFSCTVTDPCTKFWKLHKAMHGNRTQSDILDFRRDDDVWVRKPEEKGTALLE